MLGLVSWQASFIAFVSHDFQVLFTNAKLAEARSNTECSGELANRLNTLDSGIP